MTAPASPGQAGTLSYEQAGVNYDLIDPRSGSMDQLAFGAADIGGKRDRRIERPAAIFARADQAADWVRPVDPRDGASLQFLVETGSLARLFHCGEARMDLFQEVALDDREDRAALAVVARLQAGRECSE